MDMATNENDTFMELKVSLGLEGLFYWNKSDHHFSRNLRNDKGFDPVVLLGN